MALNFPGMLSVNLRNLPRSITNHLNKMLFYDCPACEGFITGGHPECPNVSECTNAKGCIRKKQPKFRLPKIFKGYGNTDKSKDKGSNSGQ